MHVILTANLDGQVIIWEALLSSFYKQQRRDTSVVDRVLKSRRICVLTMFPSMMAPNICDSTKPFYSFVTSLFSLFLPSGIITGS